MRRHALLLACLSALLAPLALSSPAALAQGSGTSTSAGDQQYVDPLASTTPHSAAHHHAKASPPASPSSGSQSDPGSGTLSQTPPGSLGGSSTGTSTTSSASASSSSTDSAHMLPFTGLDVWACLAAGLGLVGAGLALRLIARRA